jgi:signal transduction histidine kinase
MNSIHSRQVFAEQVTLLYKLLPLGLIATLFNSSILAALLFNLVPKKFLFTWISLLFFVAIIRGVLYRFTMKNISEKKNCEFLANVFFAGMLLSGILWGTAAFFSFFHSSDTHRVLVAYVLGGMTAGSSGTYNAIRRVYFAFSIPALFPQIIIFFASDNMILIAMGGMLMLFWVLITISALINHTITVTSFRLRFERQDLISSLEIAREQTETKNIDLQKEVIRRQNVEIALRNAHALLEKKVEQRTAELKTANSNLEDANRDLSAFSYSVSHDLRSPLKSIEGFSTILEEESGNILSETAREAIFYIRKSAQRMHEIIDDLLVLSRAGQMELEKSSVDLSSIVTEITETLQSQQPERKVEFMIQSNITAACDIRLIRIALENLIGNAWKYTSKTEYARIEFFTIKKCGQLIYCIEDNGAGFEMKFADKLFAPFKRLHNASAFPGTGIGLATTHKIITRHGGKIWAESTPEHGAKFYFTLKE